MKELIKLYITFFKIGIVTFGGGYAMLPILQRDVVDKNKWATEEELLDYYAIGQCTPGVIAVNVATFIGYKLKGVVGGMLTTLGVISPSVIIISVIAAFITNFSEIPAVKHAFSGIRVCVCVLILNSVLKICKNALVDKWTYIIFGVVLVLAFFVNVSAVYLVIGAGFIGFIIKKFIKKEGK